MLVVLAAPWLVAYESNQPWMVSSHQATVLYLALVCEDVLLLEWVNGFVLVTSATTRQVDESDAMAFITKADCVGLNRRDTRGTVAYSFLYSS